MKNFIFMQSLACCEKEHAVSQAVTAANKPLNRFNNITACEYVNLSKKSSCVVYSDDDNLIVLLPITGHRIVRGTISMPHTSMYENKNT